MKKLAAFFALSALCGCAATADKIAVPVPLVPAFAETVPAPSLRDAADDPAIFVAGDGKALILGTDKQTGLYVYDLSGALLQSLPIGPLNNVDLRGTLAVATNDLTDHIEVFSIDAAAGTVAHLGGFPTQKREPYGLCIGRNSGGFDVAVTYKDGAVQMFDLPAPASAPFAPRLAATLAFGSQLEGCVFDEDGGRLFVGEEMRGLHVVDLAALDAPPTLVDAVGGPSGLVPDVEGVSIWRGENGAGYIVVSAQGANRFIVYDRAPPHRPVGAFRAALGADAVTVTDGLDIVSAPIGDALPRGLLVVQDDKNTDPPANQNFKLVDWRAVEKALGLAQ